MKTLSIILIAFLTLSLSSEVSAQKSSKKQILLSAIKVTSKTAGFLSHIDGDAFLLDVSGVLRPAKGYKMVYLSSARKIIIIGGSLKISEVSKQEGTVDIGGGVLFSCFGCESCQIRGPKESDRKKSYSCISGGCSTGCSSFVEVPMKLALQFQTPGGNNGWQDGSDL
jgi:hypothetical protein